MKVSPDFCRGIFLLFCQAAFSPCAYGVCCVTMDTVKRQVKAMQWTDEQRRAIETKDHNILLSAAAGSGKTTVLVARVLDLISGGAKIRYGILGRLEISEQ